MRDGIGVYARGDVERRRAAGEAVTVLSPPDGGGDVRVAFRGGRAFLRAARLGPGFDRIVLHFQPSLYFVPRRPFSKMTTALALALLTVARGRMLEIVVHEADPPALWRPDYLLLRSVFHRADRCTFHTREEWQALEREYHTRVNGVVVEHRVEPLASVGRDEARAALGIPTDAVLFVCVGFVQPSKGYDRALDAFARAAIPSGRLAIVGSVRDGTATNRAYARALAERAKQVDGASFVEAFLPDEDVDRWIAAADRVVVPYRRAWSSGVLARAHAIGTPAIVARTGGLAEQAAAKDVIVDDDEGLVTAMRDAGGSPPPVRGGAGVPVPSPHAHPHDPRQEWNPELHGPDEEGKGRGVLIGMILISVVLAAVAQLTLKHGMNQVTDQGTVPLQLGKPIDMLRRVVVNPSVVGGLAIFVLSAVFWLVVLSRVSLSFAYPFVSLTYVLILIFDRFVLDQPVSPLRYAGVALILAGLVLISRTHSTA